MDWFCLRESKEKASAMLTAAIDTREDASSSLSQMDKITDKFGSDDS